jgi:hypothetical protein
VRIDLPRKLAPHGEAQIAEHLPEHCPYTLDQVLGDFWLGPRTAGNA